MYDVDTQMDTVTGGSCGNESYAYGADARRVWKQTTTTGTTEEIYFYGAEGNRLMTVQPVVTTGSITFTVLKKFVYFGNRQVRADNGSGWKPIFADRLGSVRKEGTESLDYYPYGEEKPSTTTQNRDKFATYHRDSTTALDYAHHRYYSSGLGRFTSADPSDVGSGAGPQSWNRYGYAGNDPVGHIDPTGLDLEISIEIGFGGGGGFMGNHDMILRKPNAGPAAWGCPVGSQFSPLPGGYCFQIVAPRPPSPAPQPKSEPGPDCDIRVETKQGTPPRNDQKFIGIAWYAPPNDQIGPYTRDVFFGGWFYAVQIQGTLRGDTNDSNWTPDQWLVVNGTYTLEFQDKIGSPHRLNVSQPDTPKLAAIFRGLGNIDWLDLPGLLKAGDPGPGEVFSASLDFAFESTLTHKSGSSCTEYWDLHLEVTAGQGGMSVKY